jgi:hypothetical protein
MCRHAYVHTRSGDGFVIAGGGGIVILEELNHALARGAKVRPRTYKYVNMKIIQNMWSYSDKCSCLFRITYHRAKS